MNTRPEDFARELRNDIIGRIYGGGVNNRAYLFLRAIRGPIVLITVGVLFALDQFGVLRFNETWPLILIVLGLLKLVERVVFPGAAGCSRQRGGSWPPPPPPPGRVRQ